MSKYCIIKILCTATDVGIYGLVALSQPCYHSMLLLLVLVSLHCGPGSRFLLPFDFVRNLFYFLVVLELVLKIYQNNLLKWSVKEDGCSMEQMKWLLLTVLVGFSTCSCLGMP